MRSHTHLSASIKLNLLDIFVAVSVLTIIGIRFFLELTGYPQLGGDGLHIAHLLWGGLALTAASLYLLMADRPNKYFASLLSAVGFGFFIDEIGKYVTSDNDYFYKPTAFIIYVLLLTIWLCIRLIITRSYSRSYLSPAEWPKRKYQRVLVIIYSMVYAFTGIILIVYLWLTNSNLLGLSGTIEKIFMVILISIASLYVIGAYHYSKGDLLYSASLIRLGALITLVFVYPLNFYREHFSAAIGCLVSVAVVIALSETSVKTIWQPLFQSRSKK